MLYAFIILLTICVYVICIYLSLKDIFEKVNHRSIDFPLNLQYYGDKDSIVKYSLNLFEIPFTESGGSYYKINP